MAKHKNIPVAVVGVGALFPESPTALGFWNNILDGTDLIGDVPEGRWRVEDFFDPDQSAPDKTYARRGGFIEHTAFDAMKFGVPPNIVEATDTSQLLALIVAQQVLDDAARGQFESLDRDRISVVLGVTSGQELMNEMASRLQRPQWIKGLRQAGLPESKVQEACARIADQYTPWQESTFPGLLGNVVAGRIANRFDLGGTNAVTDAACGSTLAAMTMGLNELYLGHSDVVIAGGVDTFNDIFMYMCFSKTPALSASGDCRPFSDAADGTMLGEGLAMFALKRLDDAERDGDEIYAVLTGLGSSSDGRAKSIYAPVSEGQAKALRRTYERAGYSPSTVELMEAHGTGTKAGDAAEFGGLSLVYDAAGREDRQWCALGSVKSQVGHTKAAAGAAGLFKIVMALHHKVLPPTIKIDRPNPKLEVEQTPFYLNTEARPWIRGSDHPRRASVSAFGFGGSNFHLAAEEYVGPNAKPRFRHARAELIVVAGASGSDVADRCVELSDSLDQHTLDGIARDTQLAYDGGHARLAIVAESLDDLRRKLAQAADTIKNAPDNGFTLPNGIYFGTADAGRTAFLFPGQGSQTVNMGRDLAIAFEPARRVWDRSADIDFVGEPLHRVVFPIPAFDDETRGAQEAKLTATEWAQPALGAASLATLAILRELGLSADAVGGHSFGEVCALHAAGVVDETAALRIARRRGELMAEAAESTSGTMCAVQEKAETLEELLAKWKSDAVVANYNGPRQTVLSGAVAAIEDAEARLEEAGIAFKRLNVATAFHSSIVADSAKPFAKFLDDVELGAATVPVWANSSAAPYADDAAEIRNTLANQIAAPVRFEQMIRGMLDDGITTFVEVGPGTVLTRLVRRIAQDESIACISTDARGRDGVTALWHALGQWIAAGATPDFAPVWDHVFVTEPAGPPPKLTIDIWGGNYNRPYPPVDGNIPGPNPEERPAPAPRAVPAKLAPPQEQVQPEKSMSNRDDQRQPPQHPQQQPSSAPVDSAWVHAFAESQRQMANAHAAYQQAMAQTHTAFLQAVASSQANMTSMLNGAHAVPTQLPAYTPPAQLPTQPIAAPAQPAPQTFAAPALPAPAPTPQPPVAPPAPRPAPVAQAAPAPIPAPPAAPAQVAPPAAGRDLEALLLDVVADKTGYPAEMLELEMQLESDLGIDSIKRVEILSALQEAAPELPEMDGNAMGQLQTLGEIVTFLGQHTPAGRPAVAETRPLPTAQPTAVNPAVNGVGDIKSVLLAAVSDKTGYPTEMLELDMKLEADLGIDSIKRVEILSAVNEALPELPEVDGSDMAGLGTLREILDFMHEAVDEKKNVRLSI